MTQPWRVGEHYGIHVYEGDRPVATFHDAEDAERAVSAVAAARAAARNYPATGLPLVIETSGGEVTIRDEGVALALEIDEGYNGEGPPSTVWLNEASAGRLANALLDWYAARG